MKFYFYLDIDRVYPDGTICYIWRLYAEPTAQEIIDIINKEHEQL